MPFTTRSITFRDYRNAVDGQIKAGCMFGQVEDFINACAIEEEYKAALWLWAWRRQPRDVQGTFSDAEVLGLAKT